nr:hypothetical protein [Tanacetum cinerariifolium]
MFNMKDVETRCQPLGYHFKLTKKQAPTIEAARRRMAKVSYALAVGSVMYTMAVKWLLRYLKGTWKATLCFSRKDVVLEGSSDSDYEDFLDLGKSTTGYVFTIGEVCAEAIHPTEEVCTEVREGALLKGRWFEVYRGYLRRGVVK